MLITKIYGSCFVELFGSAGRVGTQKKHNEKQKHLHPDLIFQVMALIIVRNVPFVWEAHPLLEGNSTALCKRWELFNIHLPGQSLTLLTKTHYPADRSTLLYISWSSCDIYETLRMRVLLFIIDCKF